MANTQIKDEKEYDNLNTQLKHMFETGLHKVPNAYESTGLNANSFFKFDLEIRNRENPNKIVIFYRIKRILYKISELIYIIKY